VNREAADKAAANRAAAAAGGQAEDLAKRVRLRPLETTDLPLLHRWLNAPHLRRFYRKTPISLAEVRSKYLPLTRHDGPTRSHLALLDERPFGYLQGYRNESYPDYAAVIETTDGVSVDLFIGEETLLGRGLGVVMLRAYLLELRRLFPDQSRVYILHDCENAAALACSRRAGFRQIREVIEDGVPSVLLCHEHAPSEANARDETESRPPVPSPR